MMRIVQKGVSLWKLRGVRYVFFGGLTTLVNLIVFFIFLKIAKNPADYGRSAQHIPLPYPGLLLSESGCSPLFS